MDLSAVFQKLDTQHKAERRRDLLPKPTEADLSKERARRLFARCLLGMCAVYVVIAWALS